MMRITIHFTALSLLSFLLLAGCDYYENYETRYNGNVEGTIYDRATGQTLEGVSIVEPTTLAVVETSDARARAVAADLVAARYYQPPSVHRI